MDKYYLELAQQVTIEAIGKLWKAHGYLLKAGAHSNSFWLTWLVGIIRKLQELIECWR